MKKITLFLLCFAAALVLHPTAQVQLPTKAQRFAMELELCQSASAAPSKCSLFGKIQIVDSFPDVKIQKVDSFPDIKVKWVDAFADGPGEWQKVDSFPDYKVQFVTSFPDYKIKEVTSFPGCD